MVKKSSKRLNTLMIMSVIGLLISIYLTYQHYAPISSSVCDINDLASCSIVNKSIYSEIFKIPAGILGAVWFVVLGLLSYRAQKTRLLVEDIFSWSVIGIVAVIYFVWAEWQLGMICIFCTIVHILIVVAAILSGTLTWKLKR